MVLISLVCFSVVSVLVSLVVSFCGVLGGVVVVEKVRYFSILSSIYSILTVYVWTVSTAVVATVFYTAAL